MKYLNKIFGLCFVGLAIVALASCEKEPQYVDFCDIPGNKCTADTVTISAPTGNVAPLCPTPTIINFSNVEMDKQDIILGDSISFECIGLSPSACISHDAFLVRTHKNKDMDIQAFISIDTCQIGCGSAIASPGLHPIPFNYVWTPKEAGEFHLDFINIYGADIRKTITVR